MKAPRSLKSRALQLLAQRDQSRVELRRKLLAFGREAGREDETTAADLPTRVEAVLDWLEAGRFLSNERFAEARVNARAPRFGNLRIRQELARHEVTLTREAQQALADSESKRARAVRDRKFDAPPATAAEHARQARFLGARGFSTDVIRRVLRDAGRSAEDTSRFPE
jgi:regulatory protein